MSRLPESLQHHRVLSIDEKSVLAGEVRYAPLKSAWFTLMALGATVGGYLHFSWGAFLLFLVSTAIVLLLGHSLGSHRKLIHDSYQCPKWLEYALVYCGVQVGLAGPLGLMRQHELRDYAQRLPVCHDYLRHGREFWVDAWWQLHCELRLSAPPAVRIESAIAGDRFYGWLERTWMAQQLPWALLFYAWGGWGFVFWGVCARVTAGVFGHWLIGYFAHNQGGMHIGVRGAAVQGRNIPFTSLLTMGESWHNNHHAFPGSARLGLFAGEWDPGWWMLMLLRRLGLVWGLRLPPDLKTRPELEAMDSPAAVMLIGGTNGGAPAHPNLTTGWRALPWLWKEAFQQRSAVLVRPGPPHHESRIRLLLGRNVSYRASSNARRLWLAIDGKWVKGLPALLLALPRQHVSVAILAAICMPGAVVFESARSWLDLEYGT